MVVYLHALLRPFHELQVLLTYELPQLEVVVLLLRLPLQLLCELPLLLFALFLLPLLPFFQALQLQVFFFQLPLFESLPSYHSPIFISLR